MASIIRNLGVSVTANTRAFERGMKRASGAFKGFLVLAAGYAGIRALREQAEQIDRIAKMSDRLGISTQRLVGFQHAAEIMGTSTEALDKGLTILSRRLGEVIDGSGEATEQFRKLGLDANALARMDLADAVETIADRMQLLATNAEKADFAAKVFGRSGVDLLNFLNLGSKGMEEMQKEAERLGLTFDRDMAARVEHANDNLTRMKGVFAGLGRELVIFLSPLVEVIGHMTGLAKASAEVQLGIAGLELKVIDFVQTMRGKIGGIFARSPELAEQRQKIEADIHRLFAEIQSKGVPTPPPTDLVVDIGRDFSNMERTAQSALQTVASGFDIIRIKGEGVRAVVTSIAESLASMASQAFAQFLLSKATAGLGKGGQPFIPNPFSVDDARGRASGS